MINLEGTYRFVNQFTVDIINPDVIMLLEKVKANIINKTIDVDIILKTDNCEFGITLEGIPVDSFAFDINNHNDISVLSTRIINKLNEYKI